MFLEVTQVGGEKNLINENHIQRIKLNNDGTTSIMIGGDWVGVVELYEDYKRVVDFIEPQPICDE